MLLFRTVRIMFLYELISKISKLLISHREGSEIKTCIQGSYVLQFGVPLLNVEAAL